MGAMEMGSKKNVGTAARVGTRNVQWNLYLRKKSFRLGKCSCLDIRLSYHWVGYLKAPKAP